MIAHLLGGEWRERGHRRVPAAPRRVLHERGLPAARLCHGAVYRIQGFSVTARLRRAVVTCFHLSGRPSAGGPAPPSSPSPGATLSFGSNGSKSTAQTTQGMTVSGSQRQRRMAVSPWAIVAGGAAPSQRLARRHALPGALAGVGRALCHWLQPRAELWEVQGVACVETRAHCHSSQQF